MKERILLHLIEYARYAEALEVPPAITQEGIADAVDIDVPHFTQYARPLIREELIRERMAHVKGVRRRRKVYNLTDAGERTSFQLRDRLRSEVVRVRNENGVREMSVSHVLGETGGKASVLDVFRQVKETGVVDISALVAIPSPRFVELISDAPKLKSFVGRTAELEAILKPGGARVTIVRGVAGIGKSSLAAKACDLSRGVRNLFWHRVRPWDTTSSILANVGDFLSALGKPGLRSVLTRGETSRGAQVLQEDLPGTNALLVLDDAHVAGEMSIAFLRILKEAMGRTQDARALVLTREALPFYDRRDVVLTNLVAEIDLQGLNSEDVSALVSSEPDALTLVGLGQRLGGHPLFLELIKAQHAVHSGAMRDVRRFVKEEIYDTLTGDERTVMKTASLYEVPVPPDSLLSSAGLFHDVILSLVDRSLIRPVGEDRYEVHDTIRDFFQGLLSASERQGLGGFAVGQLHRLAMEAQSAGNFVGSVNCLSNAIRLSSEAVGRGALWESLGDANIRIGDVPAAFRAFREALSANPERGVSARIHRKIASTLVDRGEMEAASREVEDARRDLGDAVNLDRGWIDFVEFGIAIQRNEWDAAREHGEAAVEIFRTLNEPRGLAETLLRFEVLETHSPDADPNLAERYVEEASALSNSIDDPEFAARLHIALFHFFAYHRRGSIERAAAHVAMLSNAPQARGDPTLLPFLLMAQAWFDLDFRADLSLAAAGFSESVIAARKVYDAAAIADARGGLALAAFYRGAIEEARRSFEQCAAEMRGLGYFRGSARTPGRLAFAWLMWMIAECCLMQGDFAGFNRISLSLEEEEYRRPWDSHPAVAKVLQGVDRLIKGDLDESLRTLKEAVREGETRFSTNESPFTTSPHLAHFVYGLALRVTGNEREAAEHLQRAREIAQSCHLQAVLSFFPEEERRLAEVLRTRLQPR